jgi:hypothetical protein
LIRDAADSISNQLVIYGVYMPSNLQRFIFDQTGQDPNNLVQNELHTLTQNPIRVIVPKYGPYYGDSLIVKDVDNNRILTLGTDYKKAAFVSEASAVTGHEIYELVIITNPSVSNNVRLNAYRVVGGSYQNVYNENIVSLYNVLLNDARSVDWSNVINKQSQYTPSFHQHLINDVVGFGALVASMERVREAVLLGDSSTLQNIINDIDSLRNSFTSSLTALSTQLNQAIGTSVGTVTSSLQSEVTRATNKENEIYRKLGSGKDVASIGNRVTFTGLDAGKTWHVWNNTHPNNSTVDLHLDLANFAAGDVITFLGNYDLARNQVFRIVTSSGDILTMNNSATSVALGVQELLSLQTDGYNWIQLNQVTGVRANNKVLLLGSDQGWTQNDGQQSVFGSLIDHSVSVAGQRSRLMIGAAGDARMDVYFDGGVFVNDGQDRVLHMGDVVTGGVATNNYVNQQIQTRTTLSYAGSAVNDGVYSGSVSLSDNTHGLVVQTGNYYIGDFGNTSTLYTVYFPITFLRTYHVNLQILGTDDNNSCIAVLRSVGNNYFDFSLKEWNADIQNISIKWMALGIT